MSLCGLHPKQEIGGSISRSEEEVPTRWQARWRSVALARHQVFFLILDAEYHHKDNYQIPHEQQQLLCPRVHLEQQFRHRERS